MTHGSFTDRIARVTDEELETAGISRTEIRTAITTAYDPGIFEFPMEDDPLIPSTDSIRATAPTQLPVLLRTLGDLEASRRQAWWIAYQNYRQCFARATLTYHEAEKLQITAAQLKAETDSDVINPMVESRRHWELWQAARRARIHVKTELRMCRKTDGDAAR